MSERDTLHLAHLEALQHAYSALLEAAGIDALWIYSGAPMSHHGDDQYPAFRAYGHFVHWVPMAELSHSWLLIRPAQPPLLQIHAPDDFWHLPAQRPDAAWSRAFEIRLSDDAAPPDCSATHRAVIGDLDAQQAGAMGATLNPPALLDALDRGRLHKSAHEVACLRDANRQALAGHAAARQAFEAGAGELDIHLAYLVASRQRESALPYDSIVGLNHHAGVLHYQHYDLEAPQQRHALLVDAGHRERGYCADITRTWAGPAAPDVFASLLEAMQTLQRELISACAPGVAFVELHQRMHYALAAMLIEHGVIRCSIEAAVTGGITRAFCPHGLGHSLGIQVHDVGGKQNDAGRPLPSPATDPALRLTRPLSPGMVVTIEPGCYVIPMLLEPLRSGGLAAQIDWSLVEQLAPCGGIRLEDNIVITDTGHHNLTALAQQET
ncbi:Xaa-Pro dipeptidase [Franzmannia pantelleriensis]|uniref:Xaa-Pro dipeptidase n=1 Tax=Franzmannia pantelleriensis TaxID=48727 RepID=A0A1G9F352_9GAMM|nr:Xaa-Pro dipeptidase [Halomonas pantelleriensis]SDK82693.1 Xaa-Pro dipeptidase [Halomonas pantelleriensis]